MAGIPLKIIGYDGRVHVAPNDPDVVSISFVVSRDMTGIEQGIASRHSKIGAISARDLDAIDLNPNNLPAEIDTLNRVLDEAEVQAEQIEKKMSNSEQDAVTALSRFDFDA
jgi:hypothetical protein